MQSHYGANKEIGSDIFIYLQGGVVVKLGAK